MHTTDRIAYLGDFISYPVALAAAVSLLIMTGLVGWAVFLLNRRALQWLRRQPVVYLELTPPSFTDQTALATGQFFAILHELAAGRALRDRLRRRQLVLSLEIVSGRDTGIRYLARVPVDHEVLFRQALHAYAPDVQVSTVTDYLPAVLDEHDATVMEFRQSGHFAFPLQSYDSLGQHDPVAYLAGSMTQLAPGELSAFQLVLTPVQLPAAQRIDRLLQTTRDVRATLQQLQTAGPGRMALFFFKLPYELAAMFMKGLLVGPDVARAPSSRGVSHSESALLAAMHHKLNQPLFRANIRALTVAPDKHVRQQRARAMRAALSAFSLPGRQSLQPNPNWLVAQLRYRLELFRYRLPAAQIGNTAVLSTSELSGLYHFPHSTSARTDNVVKALSKTLPAPVSVKAAAPDILLGENDHHGVRTPIGLTSAERQRHVYIIGGTGNGKTTMLLYAIVQDIRSGKGLAVIDPHGDLAETILRHIPPERHDDVIYLNPDDLSHPIGMNLLELPDGLSGDDLLREKDLVTESTISVLRKLFSDDDSGGHRIEYVLRNAIQTALTVEGATLFTIFRLLNDKTYRQSVVKQLDDEDMKNFWNNEFGKAGEYQRVKMAAGITAKIGRFLFSASAKRMLEQERSSIDFAEVLDSGKILVCNFSKGLLGEDTSTLFGTTVLAKLQVAALRRARLVQAERQPFYLYVDEFQNFATMSFVQMLSEARKYKLYLTMAEQSTAQQDQRRLVDIILANVGTVICFRSGSPADERLLLPLFAPYLRSGEIANLPAYRFYARIAAVQAQEPMSGTTVLLETDGSDSLAQATIELSRNTYGRQASVPPLPVKATVSGKRRTEKRPLSPAAKQSNDMANVA